jgi:hypothetical protein
MIERVLKIRSISAASSHQARNGRRPSGRLGESLATLHVSRAITSPRRLTRGKDPAGYRSGRKRPGLNAR